MTALFWAGKLHRATMTDRLKLRFILILARPNKRPFFLSE
jgi:hypothetical protein